MDKEENPLVMGTTVFKVTYPDGDEEFWTSVEEEEVERLENLYGGKKLIIEKVRTDNV